MHFSRLWCISLAFALQGALGTSASIDRHAVVSQYNPTRNASNAVTPMQVGNGNFAFGADVTGLQTFLPYAIMSSWGWKNDSFPPGRTLQDILDYQGVSWPNHGRMVEYMFDGVADIQQWLISNPNRVNLGQVGLVFLSSNGSALNVTEEELVGKYQMLDLWSGQIHSSFQYEDSTVNITTTCSMDDDVVSIELESTMLKEGKLALFLDFPWNDGSQKFEAPFVGAFNMTANHTTTLHTGTGLPSGAQAQISHTLVNSTFVTTVGGDSFEITRNDPLTHRYTMHPHSTSSSKFSIAVGYGLKAIPVTSTSAIIKSSMDGWEGYWSDNGFLDVATGTEDSRAEELQRRIILSRYHMRVNEAGDAPPQESGLANNGWYGKFHMEEVFWHSAHWALWNNWDLYNSILTVYPTFLRTSLERSQKQQHWDKGARWGKESDPSGRSAPGEINELLIWQQPHPLIFAEYEYRSFPSNATLDKWEEVIFQTAEWMSAFAWWNGTIDENGIANGGKYDLGPPMYVVSENTSPNITLNPAFELAYWRFGLDLASDWMNRLGKSVPLSWSLVKDTLASLPVELYNGTEVYAIYEGIEKDFWYDVAYINDHPALVGLYGWLPQTPGVDISVVRSTTEMVWQTWNLTNCWGWDFPMLAMNAAKLNETSAAIDWLLDPLFAFDDIGMPIGGVRVPTPYFPGSGALLYTVALMAEGWDGYEGESQNGAPGFPGDWNVRKEGLNRAF